MSLLKSYAYRRTMCVPTVLSDVDDLLAARRDRVVVGVTGPPGAGKSTIAGAIVEHHRHVHGEDAVGYLPMDGFHLSNAVLARLGRADRKGAPDTFDVEGYIALLTRVTRADHDVYAPDFDHTAGEPIAASLVLPATARLIVTEGNYLGLEDTRWTGVFGLLDRLYYVDAPTEVRRERLVRRHIAAGKSAAAAQAWVDDVDEPNARLVATARHRAHLVLDGTSNWR